MNPYREPQKPTSRLREFFVNRTRALWPTVVILAALSALGATQALRLNGFKIGANDNVIFVATCGAVGDGTTDDTTAIQNCANLTTSGSVLKLSAATYKTTDAITITADHVHVVGAGVNSTIIKFDPASTKSAFKFANGATEMYGNSITGIRFISTGSNVQKKTAIEVVDTSGMLIEDIWIDPQNSSTWTGGGSVGLAIKGRELTRINRIRAFTDQPIQISDDPNTAGTVDDDHMHISDTYLRPTPSGPGDRSAILIDDGVIISNLTIDGAEAWIVDKYGLHWVETGGTSAAATNISISGVRCEQAVDVTGYCIYVDHTKGIYNFDVRDAQMSTNLAQNGMHFFGINNLTIKNSVFGANDAARQHLNITGSVTDLFLENNYVQTTTPSTLTGLTLIQAMPQVNTAASIPSTAWYSDSTTASTKGASLSANVTLVGTVFRNSSTANTTPITFATSNTWSAGTCMVTFTNTSSNTLEACIDNGGDFLSTNGTFDRLSAGTMSLCPNTATGCDWGKNGASANIKGLLQTGIPAKANNTIASAATIAPTGFITHITGTVSIVTMTAPAGFAQTNGGGCLNLVFDGIAPWTAGGNIFVAGTPTTAGTSVTFCYDNATTKWYPSRTL